MRFSDEKYYNQYKLLGSEPGVFGSLEPEPEPLEKNPEPEPEPEPEPLGKKVWSWSR